MKVKFGIDLIDSEIDFFKGKRLGLVTNDAACDSQGQKTRKVLMDKGLNLVNIFSPEHGIDVRGEDGAFMADGRDPLTRLPIISLYGDHLKPTAHHLSDIDLLLFDIPDIGARFYTYLWTLSYVLEAASEQQIPLCIFDRPNPLSGQLDWAEGPILNEEACSSFIGRWAIPIRHSCTLGELAHYFNSTRNLKVQLQIIRCQNWKRDTFFPEWHQTFVPTSPAIQHFESMLFYPGTGLLEAVNISEGRGGPSPFQTFGAPWLPHNLSVKNLQGAVLKEQSFMPSMGEFQNQACQGFRWECTDKAQLRPVWNMLITLKTLHDTYPEQFEWRTYPTRVNPSGENHLDYLLGISQVSQTFELGYAQFCEFWEAKLQVQHWKSEIQPFLLY